MGSLNNSYRRICFEAYRMLCYTLQVDKTLKLEEIEEKLQNMEHNSQFYYKCGIAVAKILKDISKNEGCDGINASFGGADMFESLIGLDNAWEMENYNIWKDTSKYNNMISAFQCDFTCVRDRVGNLRLSNLDTAITNKDNPRHKRINEDINLLEELEWLIRSGKAKIMVKEGE